MAHLRIIALLLLALGCAGRASAQPARSYTALRFDHLTVDQGLSQTSVTEIFQDHQGFLWLGTSDGLNRYDGYAVTTYKHDPDDSNSLAANAISSVYEAPTEPGVLWVGSHSDGLTRFDRRTGTFTRYRHDPDDRPHQPAQQCHPGPARGP